MLFLFSFQSGAMSIDTLVSCGCDFGLWFYSCCLFFLRGVSFLMAYTRSKQDSLSLMSWFAFLVYFYTFYASIRLHVVCSLWICIFVLRLWIYISRFTGTRPEVSLESRFPSFSESPRVMVFSVFVRSFTELLTQANPINLVMYSIFHSHGEIQVQSTNRPEQNPLSNETHRTTTPHRGDIDSLNSVVQLTLINLQRSKTNYIPIQISTSQHGVYF